MNRRPPHIARPGRKTLACCLAAGLALLAGNTAAQVDEVQLRLLKQFELPLRWDNVGADRPWWVFGVRPAWHGGQGLHVVRLEPGQSVTLRVAAHESVRVHAVDDVGQRVLAAAASPLSVAFSNGTGLYARQSPRRTADGRDWVVDAGTGAPQAGPQLARVALAANAADPVEVALFVSRHEPMGRIAPYRRVHDLPGTALDVQRAIDSRPQHFWALAPQTPVEIEVEGPARFALRMRLRYPATEAAGAQHWHIDATLDGQPLARLEFATGAENAWPVYVDGVAAVVSREKEGYFEVPEGRHRLTLATDAPVIARLQSQSGQDYLLPALNAPSPDAAAVRDEIAGETPLALRLSGWGDAAARAAAVLADRDKASPSEVHAAALRLVRDNRSREGSAIAAAAMREAAAGRRDDPTLRSEAGEYLLHTFYRDLLPREKHPAGRLRTAWYLAPRLLAAGEDGRGTVLAGQHAGEMPGSLAQGLFVPLGSGADAAPLAYDLPQRFAPSSLRIALHGDAALDGMTVFVQYDDEAPTPLTLSHYPDLPGDRFVPSAGEAALRLMQERFADAADEAGRSDGRLPPDGDGFGTGTLSGAFNRRFIPAPLVAARIVDLPLPGGVRRVRVWRGERDDMRPLWAALAYRAARPFRLTERVWLEAARSQRNGPADEQGALAPFFAATGRLAEQATPADAELDSHWQPLARLLRAQSAQFAAGIAAPPATPPAPPAARKGAAAQAARDAAHLAAQGQWLGALEAWSVAAASPDATLREQAFDGRITALRQLGEAFVAERLLRQRMLHDPDARARRSARETLITIATGAGDLDGVQTVLAAALLREGADAPDAPALLAALATTLLDNGEADLALGAGLLLPRHERPAETLLRAAFAQEWWAVFDDLVAGLADPARQRFWQAQRALAGGRIADAETALRDAGTEGAAFAAHIARARTIHAALRDGTGDPAQTLADWADWQASHPGPRRWRDATHLASDFAGAQGMWSIDRDAYFNAFLATPERPLRLRVAGPARLRIEARPLHSADSTDRIDGWLHVRNDHREWLTPITDNAGTPALQLVGNPEQAAGRAVTQEITLGPGWHELRADGGDRSLLVRASIEEAELPLPLLPRLTPDTAAARARGTGIALRAIDRWPPVCMDCTVLLDVRPGAAPRSERLARTLIDANPATLADAELPPLPTPPAAMAPATDDATLRAARDWHALLTWPVERTAEALRERLVSLAWLAEQQPEQQQAALALAADIVNGHPAVPGLAALLARIERDAMWTPVTSVNHSAGLRPLDVTGWDPESPSLRVRRALLAPTDDDERVLAGSNRLVAALGGAATTQVELTLSAEDVAALPAQVMTVLVQVDDAPAQRIVLAPGDAPAQRRIDLPAGGHTVRVWIETPLADQFLRIRLREPGGKGFAGATERFWHVATRAEPVRLAVDGPAWLRIDERVDGRTESRYLRIEGRWQHVVLPPADGRQESLYRLHLRGIDADRPRSALRTFNAGPQPVAPPALTIADQSAATGIVLDDVLPPGGQEDGTWSLGVARHDRLYGFEDSLAPAARGTQRQEHERFTELAATWRWFADAWRTHYRGDVLVRDRERGGATLGLRGAATTRPAWTNWDFGIEGSAFGQAPGGDGHTEMSWNLRASASHAVALTPQLALQPRIALFWRGQSLGGTPFYREGRIDQDIWSPYRENHPRGIEVGETLTWAPWLDTAFYAGGSVTSNQDMNPLKSADHVAGRIGWRQLLGTVRFDAGWDGRRYFEDADRKRDSTTGALNLDLAWEHWLPRQERLELGMTLRRDLGRDRSLFGLSLTWHFGNGRALRDFRPGETPFRELRERHAPQDQNNRMRDEP